MLACGFGDDARFGDWAVDEGRVVRSESLKVGISGR
jgi:hypothetical protein